MQRKVVFVILALVLVLGTFGALVLAACGSNGDTGARDESAAPSAAATGEPLKIGFDEGFTGFMAVDADMTDKGIQTGHRAARRPDRRPARSSTSRPTTRSDPVQAVDKARQLVESDKIDVMLGPIFSPANAAVTDYLAKNGGIPSISIYGQPIDNLKTANGLSFMPSGHLLRSPATSPASTPPKSWATRRPTASTTRTQPVGSCRKASTTASRRAAGRSSARSSCRSTPSTSVRTSRRLKDADCTTGGSSATAPRPSSSSTTTTASRRRSSPPWPATSPSRSWRTSVTSPSA